MSTGSDGPAPKNELRPEDELSDDELNGVAGGATASLQASASKVGIGGFGIGTLGAKP